MFSPDVLRQRIVTAIAESCYRSPEEIRPDLSLVDLGLDSLAITSIVGEIESLSKQEFDRDQITTMFQANSVGDLIAHVLKVIGNGRSQTPLAAS